MTEQEIKDKAKDVYIRCFDNDINYPCVLDALEIAIRESTEEKIADLKANCDLAIEGRDVKIMELEQQIEKMKSQYDYAFNQLCKSREILCSMLSQYRDRKEIDYSTRESGEKLLKEGVYKND